MKKPIGAYLNSASSTKCDAWLHFVRGDSSLPAYLNAGVECYKGVFAGPPYFENYDGQEQTFIEPMFLDFATNGILVFVMTAENPADAEMIGFAASIGADRSEVADFLASQQSVLPAAASQLLYMAEVAVKQEYRQQGLGSLLVKSRVEEAGRIFPGQFTHALMRTAAEGSNSAGIYQRLGAQDVQGLIQEKSDFATQSTRRIFLWLKM